MKEEAMGDGWSVSGRDIDWVIELEAVQDGSIVGLTQLGAI